MIHHPHQSFLSDLPEADLLVTVLMRAAFILAVIQMNCKEPVQAYHLIKMPEHPVQVIHDIISGIPDMAGIKAYTDLLLPLCPVKDSL